MSGELTASKIVMATRFDGKKVKYLTSLTMNVVNESQYQIMSYVTREIEASNGASETFHPLEDEEIIYSPNDLLHKLTHKGDVIRPSRIDKLDVYTIIYESRPGWVEEANIPCELFDDVIDKIPKPVIKKETRGRHKKYSNDNDRKVAQQKHALLHHYRKEALEKYLQTHPHEDIITVKVNISSRVLGEFNEEISYKRLQDGSYRKIQQ